jgi:hypothetical protein
MLHFYYLVPLLMTATGSFYKGEELASRGRLRYGDEMDRSYAPSEDLSGERIRDLSKVHIGFTLEKKREDYEICRFPRSAMVKWHPEGMPAVMPDNIADGPNNIPEENIKISTKFRHLFKNLLAEKTPNHWHGISYSYSFPKVAIAIIQILYGSFSLYHTAEDEIRRFDYVSPSLTLVPYITMSVVNLYIVAGPPDPPESRLVSEGVSFV